MKTAKQTLKHIVCNESFSANTIFIFIIKIKQKYVLFGV